MAQIASIRSKDARAEKIVLVQKIVEELIASKFREIQGEEIKFGIHSKNFFAFARPKLFGSHYMIKINPEELKNFILSHSDNILKALISLEGILAHEIAHIVAYKNTLNSLKDYRNLISSYYTDLPNVMEFVFSTCSKNSKLDAYRDQRIRFEKWADAYAIYKGFDIGYFNNWILDEREYDSADFYLRKASYITLEEEKIWRSSENSKVKEWKKKFRQVESGDKLNSSLQSFIKDFPKSFESQSTGM